MSTFDNPNFDQNFNKTAEIRKIREFWLKYGDKIILTIGVILIAAISFEAGYLKGHKNQKESLVFSQPNCQTTAQDIETKSTTNATATLSSKSVAGDSQNTIASENQRCAFVASKNSNKYHLPTCQWAKRIKPENQICFSSKQEAESRGYQGAKCCIK